MLFFEYVKNTRQHALAKGIKQYEDTVKETSKIPLYVYKYEVGSTKDVDTTFEKISLPHIAQAFNVFLPDSFFTKEALFIIIEENQKYQIKAFFKHLEYSDVTFVIELMITRPRNEGEDSLIRIIEHNLKNYLNENDAQETLTTYSKYIYLMLCTFNEVINSDKEIREGREVRRVKVNPLQKKKAYSDFTLIHLSKKKYISEYTGSRNIVWNHSWVVRGHWRYYSDRAMIGKNRQGERLESGRTWVSEFHKQKDLEFKNKIRKFEDIKPRREDETR